MKSLLTAELYKLKQSKPVIGLLVLAFVIPTYVIPFVRRGRAYSTASEETLRWAAAVFMNVNYIIAGIFIGLVITSEFQNGLIRNVICMGNSRVQIYLSRLFSASVITVAIFIVYSFSKIVLIGFMEGFAGLDWVVISKYGMVFLPYYLAVAATFTLFAFVSKKSGITVALCFIYTMFIFHSPSLLDVRFLPQFFIYTYFVGTHLDFHRDFTYLLHGAAVSVAHMVIVTVFGGVVFIKSDIK